MKSLNELKKCKFCHQREDGGKVVLKEEVSCGELGTLQAGVTMLDFREEYKYPPTLRLWMWNERDGGYGEQLGNELRIEIKYCPFCGKKLRERGSYDEV